MPEHREFVRAFIDELRLRARDPIFGESAEARVCARIADELEARYAAFLAAEVTIAEAAALSGYDESSLRRWRAQGTISLRRRDIPRKPGHGVDRTMRRIDGGPPSIADEILRNIHTAGGAPRRAPSRKRR